MKTIHKVNTKSIRVYLSKPWEKKGRGKFHIRSANTSLLFGLREARTMQRALNNFFGDQQPLNRPS